MELEIKTYFSCVVYLTIPYFITCHDNHRISSFISEFLFNFDHFRSHHTASIFSRLREKAKFGQFSFIKHTVFSISHNALCDTQGNSR